METLTLYQLNALVGDAIRSQLDGEYWLCAEIAEAREAGGGHLYLEFIEKDAEGKQLIARARATLWSRQHHLLAPLFERATGQKLIAGIRVRVLINIVFHELYGYSLNILDIDPSYTLGDLVRRRREILEQLEADGIINDNRQLPLPRLMKRIAVISSPTAAGYGDFCHQLENNDYGLHFDIKLFPALMQGEGVEASVMAALAAIADEAEQWDCVVIIRGGGATTDLIHFDSYALAATVAQMPIPVITGIGHERDDTVLDTVAHTSVKTPTAAAAFVIDHEAQQLTLIAQLAQRFVQATTQRLEMEKHKLILHARMMTSVRHSLATEPQRLEGLYNRIAQGAKFLLKNSQLSVEHYAARLQALDPQLQLRRGYSLTFDANGRLVRSAIDLKPSERITTRFADGTIVSTVEPS